MVDRVVLVSTVNGLLNRDLSSIINLDVGEFEDFEEVEPVGPVKGELWWNHLWIPIATNGGKRVQIITFWHDREQRQVVSDSLEEWFHQIVIYLNNGTYKLVEEDGELVFNNYGFIEE